MHESAARYSRASSERHSPLPATPHREPSWSFGASSIYLKLYVHNLLPDDLICYRLLPRFESNWAVSLMRYSAGQARSDFTSRQACDGWTMGAAGEGK